MGTVQRIQQFIENKGISKYRFYQESGLSNGALDKGENIGSDKCEKILYAFPELNPEWLLTGRGSMLKNDQQSLAKEIDAAKGEGLSEVVLAKKNRIPFYDDISTIGGINDHIATLDPSNPSEWQFSVRAEAVGSVCSIYFRIYRLVGNRA